MSLEILIDGYNLINKWNTLKDMFRQSPEDARTYLIDILSTYRKIKKHKIKLIFDAYNSYSLLPSNFAAKGIIIIFTAMGETADEYIKKTVAVNGEKYLVVTSDNAIKNFVEHQRATSINSEEFINKLELSFYINLKGEDSFDFYEKTTQITTKKKGNPRKLPKKLRKKIKKIKKL